MSDFLFDYHKVNPTTWVYLSSLLTISLYFKFSRVLSVRNLDLIGLITLAPGLLVVEYGLFKQSVGLQQIGYIWLFVASGLFMVRLLLDPMMVRRPLLEPNLSVGGMTFLGISLLVFLMANVINSRPTPDDLEGANSADQVRAPVATNAEKAPVPKGPGYPLLHLLPSLSTQSLTADKPQQPSPPELDAAAELQSQHDARGDVVHIASARVIAILSHLAIVIGMVVIGYRHFDNVRAGIAAATLYLLLPYTAQLTGRVDHALPAALLVWAIAAYRRPLVSGLLMGGAVGVIFYPLFLLPLWLGFYWQRGLLRFSLGVVTALALMVGSLAFVSDNLATFGMQVQQMFGGNILSPHDVQGFWSLDIIPPVYRYPVLMALAAFCISLALWPAQKNLGTLMSCSAAVMMAVQFWHPHGGGLYMAWFLPLVLLTIFRPNLEDRVALSVLGQGWFPKRRANLAGTDQAA